MIGRWRLVTVGWLTLVWVLLWGTFTPLSVLGGVLLAIAVVVLFPMPKPADRLPLRPWPLLRLLGFLAYDLVVSGAEVSWQVLRHGSGARGAVLELPLLSRSDRVVTAIANALSLSPGTMVLQIDHAHGRFAVYALGPRDAAAVDRVRRGVLRVQERVLAALGSAEELAECRRRLAAHRGGVEGRAT